MRGKLTDKEWVELIEKTVKNSHKGLRLGQSYMVALSDVKKSLYDEITATENDCFYEDNAIHNFINYLNE